MSGIIFLDTIELSISETEGVALVPVARSGDLSRAVTIEYGVTGLDATPGQDFIATTGTVTLTPGQASGVIPVTILDDNLSEATETAVVSLINVDSGFLQAPRTARVEILDNENPVVDPPQPPLVSDFTVSQIPVLTGLVQPIDLEFAPASLQPSASSGRAFVAEQGGRIVVVDTATGGIVSEFIDISDQVNNRQDRGLLDIELHPDFPNEPYVYAFYVVDPPESQGLTGNAGPNGGGNRYAHVVRFEADPATNFTTAIPGSEEILVGGAGRSRFDISGNGAVDSTSNFQQPESGRDANGEFVDDYIKVDSRSHAGGALAFGPDGALYISIGDGTSFNAVDPRTASVQNLDSLAGKILRVDPETGLGLADNPFAEDDLSTNQSRVYQVGFRNPFSMSFDDAGRLFVTDTGWNSYEEINSGPAGANFGWPWYEGADQGVLRPTPGYQNLPEAQAFYAGVAAGAITVSAPYRGFSHNNNDPGFQFQAITGGDVDYDGNRYPEVFQNDYFFTDISQGEVFSVDLNDRTQLNYLYTTQSGFGPSHFTQGPDGYVYAVEIATGRIVRLEITGGDDRGGDLRAETFALGAGVSSLDQINFTAAPIDTRFVARIDESTNGAFAAGLPSDNFAVRYTGEFIAESAGTYTFFLTSDDGSRLFVDGALVIDNDGLQSATQSQVSIPLTAGQHAIEVRYFEATGAAVVDLDWAGPGFARTQMVFDSSLLPIANADSASTAPSVVLMGLNVLANDTDPDGDDALLSVVAVNGNGNSLGQPTTGSAGGQFVIAPDGTASFDPAGDFAALAPGQTVTTGVSYTIEDGIGGLATSTFTVDVTAPPATGSVIVIEARGDEGLEDFDLAIDGVVVAGFTDISTAGQTLTYVAAGSVTADQVRIVFTSDVYDPANGIDYNLTIDRISIDGAVFETEAGSVFSTGTWRPEDGITPGFGRGETLHANGYFQCASAPASGSRIEINAAGQTGNEDMALLIDGVTVATWSGIATSGDVFVFAADTDIAPESVRVAFTNDVYDPANGIDYNLVVDSVVIDGVTYESEAASTFSTGTWRPEDGIVDGFGRGEILHALGYFQYATESLG